MADLIFCGYKLKPCGTKELPRYELRLGSFWVAVVFHPSGGHLPGPWSASFAYPPPKEDIIFCSVSSALSASHAATALEQQFGGLLTTLNRLFGDTPPVSEEVAQAWFEPISRQRLTPLEDVPHE